jgi:hypothetical protein
VFRSVFLHERICQKTTPLLTLVTGANETFSHHWEPGHAINGRKVYRGGRQLQVRLVKAAQAGKGRLVRKRQYMLAHSLYGRRLAVRRVTENRGKNTPGVEGGGLAHAGEENAGGS